MLSRWLNGVLLIAVLFLTAGCDNSSSEPQFASAQERAEAAFDASCRHSCEMEEKCNPQDFYYEDVADCIEIEECGKRKTDPEEICEDEHTPDFYWNATAAVEECEVKKMRSCDIWYPPEDASEEEIEYFDENVWPCRAEMEAEDIAEEDWFETPEGQSMAEDC